jgi:hypothetical protein
MRPARAGPANRRRAAGGAQTVFVLTERGNLYRSPDAGKGWTNQINKL